MSQKKSTNKKTIRFSRFGYFLNFRQVPKTQGWSENIGFSKQQSVVPRDKRLIQKLGLKKSENILVLAGGFGDWSAAISNDCKVHYTDISPTMTAFVKRENPGKILSYRARPAELLIRRPLQYDWSFSYEPIPLESRLPLILVRSLLNRSGAKVVYSQYHPKHLQETFKLVAHLYGTKYTLKKIFVQVDPKKYQQRTIPVFLFTIQTNPVARNKAAVDIKIQALLNRLAKNGEQMVVEGMEKQLQITARELEEGQHRIEVLSQYFRDLENRV